jgi:hypothetical protein
LYFSCTSVVCLSVCLSNTSVKCILLICMVSRCCFNIAYSLGTSSWSQTRDKYLKMIPMFVTVLCSN